MRKYVPLLLWMAWVVSGCAMHLYDDRPRRPPRGEPYPYPRPPPAPRPPPPAQDVLRAKEIKAGRVYARVIYAKEVKARGGRVGRTYTDGGGKGGKGGWGSGEIHAPEVSAEIIYAKEIKADWIEADEIHAKEVKIGR